MPARSLPVSGHRLVGLYLPGNASGWIKVKTAEWREANRERYKLFEKT